MKISNDYKIIDIDEKISFVERKKENYILNRISFLHEQAEMARNLGIQNPTIDLTSMEADDGSNVTTLDKEQPFYFQGYRAIEKEIEILERRQQKTNIFDTFYADKFDLNIELEELNAEKFAIESDFTIQRLSEAFNNSPLNYNDFQAVNYDLADINYKKLNYGNLTILILGFVAAIVISFTFILSIIIFKQIR